MIESYIEMSYPLYAVFSIVTMVYITLLATGSIGCRGDGYYNVGDVAMVSIMLILMIPIAPFVLPLIVLCLIAEYMRK